MGRGTHTATQRLEDNKESMNKEVTLHFRLRWRKSSSAVLKADHIRSSQIMLVLSSIVKVKDAIKSIDRNASCGKITLTKSCADMLMLESQKHPIELCTKANERMVIDISEKSFDSSSASPGAVAKKSDGDDIPSTSTNRFDKPRKPYVERETSTGRFDKSRKPSVEPQPNKSANTRRQNTPLQVEEQTELQALELFVPRAPMLCKSAPNEVDVQIVEVECTREARPSTPLGYSRPGQAVKHDAAPSTAVQARKPDFIYSEREMCIRLIPEFCYRNIESGWYSIRMESLESAELRLPPYIDCYSIRGTKSGALTTAFYEHWSPSLMRRLQDKFSFKLEHMKWVHKVLVDNNVPVNGELTSRDLLPLRNEMEDSMLEELLGRSLTVPSHSRRPMFQLREYFSAQPYDYSLCFTLKCYREDECVPKADEEEDEVVPLTPPPKETCVEVVELSDDEDDEEVSTEVTRDSQIRTLIKQVLATITANSKLGKHPLMKLLLSFGNASELMFELATQTPQTLALIVSAIKNPNLVVPDDVLALIESKLREFCSDKRRRQRSPSKTKQTGSSGSPEPKRAQRSPSRQRSEGRTQPVPAESPTPKLSSVDLVKLFGEIRPTTSSAEPSASTATVSSIPTALTVTTTPAMHPVIPPPGISIPPPILPPPGFPPPSFASFTMPPPGFAAPPPFLPLPIRPPFTNLNIPPPVWPKR